MKNFLIFSAVVLAMLYMFTGGTESLTDQSAPSDQDEQALRDAGYYDESDPSPQQTSTSKRNSTLEDRALPNRLEGITCKLRHSDTRASLVAKLGEPTSEFDATPKMLSWKQQRWRVDAMLDDEGKMKSVTAGGASLVGLTGDTKASPLDISNLQADQYTFAQVERVLGPGVLTKVSWEAGIPIASSILAKNPSMDYATSDHCEHLYTWLVPGRKRPVTLAFRDNYLVTSFLAALSS